VGGLTWAPRMRKLKDRMERMVLPGRKGRERARWPNINAVPPGTTGDPQHEVFVGNGGPSSHCIIKTQEHLASHGGGLAGGARALPSGWATPRSGMAFRSIWPPTPLFKKLIRHAPRRPDVDRVTPGCPSSLHPLYGRAPIRVHQWEQRLTRMGGRPPPITSMIFKRSFRSGPRARGPG
jgi:hypothetical protein